MENRSAYELGKGIVSTANPHSCLCSGAFLRHSEDISDERTLENSIPDAELRRKWLVVNENGGHPWLSRRFLKRHCPRREDPPEEH